MFGKKLKNPIVLKLLSKVLNEPSTLNRRSAVSLNGEKKMYNLYATLILIDAIMKYEIIVQSDLYFETFIHRLEKLARTYRNHQELVIGVNAILGEMVRLKLGLSDVVSYQNKRKILETVYENYIVNGYFFHSFPSFFQEQVEANGLEPENYQYPKEQMKQIANIFKNHHYSSFITKDLKAKKEVLYLTDSPLMAYYYAISSPHYLCDMTATSAYMKGKIYDSFAYYRKDYKACRKNLEQLGKHVHLSEREHQVVSDAFKQQWKSLNVDESIPCIAVIERQVIGKNFLPYIEQILEDAKEESFVISMAKITDSIYPDEAWEDPILSLDFEVEILPTYQEIESGIFKEDEIKQVVSKKTIEQVEIEKLFPDEENEKSEKKPVKKAFWKRKKKKEKEPFKPPIEKEFLFPIEEEPLSFEEKEYNLDEKFQSIRKETVNNHGYADVFALSGLLCIMSGLTLILILRYFGIG